MTRQERLNGWLKQVRTGLFIHWGLNTGNPWWQEGKLLYKTVDEFEAAVNAAGWNAEKWVETAKRLNAGYITLAVFHSCLGYIRPWASGIPGTPITKRDFLKELVDCAKKQDIKIVVYIPGDPSWNTRFGDARFIDPEAYKEYKNDPNIDITSFAHWQLWFCKENIAELVKKYPDLAGFWFDGWNNMDICDEVLGFVHQLDDRLITIKNDFGAKPTKDEDIMSIECFGKINDPAFDFTTGAWLEQQYAECCYIPIGDWWYYGDIKSVDYGFLIRQLVSIVANGWIANMGLGPKLGGEFPEEIEKMVCFIERFFTWAGEALMDVQPGGLLGGRWNLGAYGFTTQRQYKDEYYVHICTPPSSDCLMIMAPGLCVESVVNLKTGKRHSFTQNQGILQILDCNFSNLKKDGVEIYKVKAQKLPPIQLDKMEIDGQDIIVSLKRSANISQVVLSQREDTSITYGGWASPRSDRICGFELYKSDDKQNFQSVVSGSFKNTRGHKELFLSDCRAKYLKLSVKDTFYGEAGKMERMEGIYWAKTTYEKDIASLAVDYNGIVWYVSKDNVLYKDAGSCCVSVSDNVKQVTVGFDRKIYVINSEGYIGDTTIKANKLEVDKNGVMYRMDENDVLWIGEKAVFDNITDFALGIDGDIWIVRDRKLYNPEPFITHMPVDRVVFVTHNKLALMSNQTVYLENYQATNLTVVSHNAGKIFAGRDGSLWKQKAENIKTVNIKDIQLF